MPPTPSIKHLVPHTNIAQLIVQTRCPPNNRCGKYSPLDHREMFFLNPLLKRVKYRGQGEGLILFWSLFRVFNHLSEEITWRVILFWLIKRIVFKKILSKTDLPFRFCKIGLRNYSLFIFGMKEVVCLLCCNTVLCHTLLNPNSDSADIQRCTI